MSDLYVKKHCELFRVKHSMSYLFFLLPHTTPAPISCSMRGTSVVDTHAEGWCVTYRKSARTTAELLTVRPMMSDVSWLSCRKVRSFSSLSVWVRMASGGFWGASLRCAICRDINSSLARRLQKNNASERRSGVSRKGGFLEEREEPPGGKMPRGSFSERVGQEEK